MLEFGFAFRKVLISVKLFFVFLLFVMRVWWRDRAWKMKNEEKLHATHSLSQNVTTEQLGDSVRTQCHYLCVQPRAHFFGIVSPINVMIELIKLRFNDFKIKLEGCGYFVVGISKFIQAVLKLVADVLGFNNVLFFFCFLKHEMLN